MSEAKPVRTFISYAWSSPTHEAWVIGLANRLVEDGVDVVLDKWDLKPGHDAHQFMESMVTDQTVSKVIMVCDRAYAQKADARQGGVGTESQIISPEIYSKGKQDKFAAAITDEDEAGNAFVPTFYKGRVYFDFRSGDKFEAAYEQLLRWIVDRPQHVKPQLGKLPEALISHAPIATGSQSSARRADDAIRQGSASAAGLLREFGERFIEAVKALAPAPSEDEQFDEAVVRSIDSIRPNLKLFLELVSSTVRYSSDLQVWNRVIEILEGLATLMWRPRDTERWHRNQGDPYKVIAHDAFLGVIALALDERRFDLAAICLSHAYLVKEESGRGGRATSDFTVFRQYSESLDFRNKRLKLNRISLEADMLEAAHPSGSLPSFESLMQADFVLYLRSYTISAPSGNWYPYSLVYAGRRFSPFPIFARSESAIFLASLLPVLGVTTIDAFKQLVLSVAATERSTRMFDYQGLPVSYLANLEHLAVLP